MRLGGAFWQHFLSYGRRLRGGGWRFKLMIAALAALLAAYSVYWVMAARRAEANLVAWIENEKAQGHDIRYSALDVGGYPYRIEATLRDFHVSGTAAGMAWEFNAPAFAGVILPWRPHHLILFAKEATARLAPANGAAATLAASALRASVVTADDNALERLSITAERLLAKGENSAGAALEVADGEAHWRAGAQASHLTPAVGAEAEEGVREPLAWQLAVKGKDITNPRLAASPYGDKIAELALVVELRGGGLNPQATPATIAAWRDTGGTVEVPSLKLAWGALDLTLSGSATLDQQFRPLGAFTAEVTGYEPAIDHLRAKGDISPEEASAAKETLKSIVNGDKGRLPVPITMQAGRMFLGPLPVANLPPLIEPLAFSAKP
ncbi:MAG: DUF2125 domain-containing protein [Sphingomonadales bacterium]|nr:DUF2125 domain-containing protein [Sphingomonadales bacterium]